MLFRCLVALALALGSALTLTACSGNPTPAPQPSSPSATTVYQAGQTLYVPDGSKVDKDASVRPVPKPIDNIPDHALQCTDDYPMLFEQFIGDDGVYTLSQVETDPASGNQHYILKFSKAVKPVSIIVSSYKTPENPDQTKFHWNDDVVVALANVEMRAGSTLSLWTGVAVPLPNKGLSFGITVCSSNR